MPEARVFRYEVPVDDEWHTFDLSGGILRVDGRRLDVVEFWALHTGGPEIERSFRVFGTGQPVAGTYVGTAVHAALVWHLFEAGPRG